MKNWEIGSAVRLGNKTSLTVVVKNAFIVTGSRCSSALLIRLHRVCLADDRSSRARARSIQREKEESRRRERKSGGIDHCDRRSSDRRSIDMWLRYDLRPYLPFPLIIVRTIYRALSADNRNVTEMISLYPIRPLIASRFDYDLKIWMVDCVALFHERIEGEMRIFSQSTDCVKSETKMTQAKFQYQDRMLRSSKMI